MQKKVHNLKRSPQQEQSRSSRAICSSHPRVYFHPARRPFLYDYAETQIETMYDGRVIRGIAERWIGETTAAYSAAQSVYPTGPSGWPPGMSPAPGPSTAPHSLLSAYEGCTVEEVFCGRDVHTTGGTCYAVEHSETISFTRPDISILADAIMEDLCLIPGIGEITADKLRRQGVRTIADLLSHPRFGADARMIAEMTAAENWGTLEAYCRRRRSASNRLLLLLSLATPISNLLFFDIETLGIFSRPIILFGTGRIQGTRMTITQYLLRDIGEEPAALCAVLEDMTAATRLVTYNGRAFDYPYLRDRAGYYRIPAPVEPTHTDLLHHVRREWRRDLPNCRLGTVEGEILGQYRNHDLPGSLVPWYYQTYRQSGNPGPLVPVMDHNRLDIANLPRIYERLLEHVTCPRH